MEKRTRFQIFWDKFLGKRSWKIMCVSEAVLEDNIKYTNIPRDKHITIHNGVDVNTFSKKNIKGIPKKNLGIPDDAFVIGSIGRLHKQKDYETLIKACAKLDKEKMPNVYVLIAGDGPEYNNLHALISVLNLSDRIKLLGTRNDVPEILACFDIFVLSSVFEGFGNAVIEAMSMPIPVISTDLPPIREIISHGENGIIVPLREPEEIADAIVSLYMSGEFRQKLSKNARRIVVERFNHEIMVKKLEELYSDAYNSK